MSRATRKAVGYTFDELSKSPAEWMQRATGFRSASEACFAADVPMPIALMLQGLALELLSKAILVASGFAVPAIHDPCKLIQEHVGIPLDLDEAAVALYLGECVIWQGKYPTPRKPEAFDKFHDDYFEALKSRSSIGNHHYVRLNPDRNPREIQAVWSRLVFEYERRLSAMGS